MRIYNLMRHQDASGVSGTGHVADAVEFQDGQTVLVWLTAQASVNVYKSFKDAVDIHGHGGASEFVLVADTDDGSWTPGRQVLP